MDSSVPWTVRALDGCHGQFQAEGSASTYPGLPAVSQSALEWDRYYRRSLARRGGLRGEDCYCTAECLRDFLLSRDLLPDGEAGQILVVGSGASDVPALLAAATPTSTPTSTGRRSGGGNVTAVDVSEAVISWMAARHPEVHWLLADASQLDAAWDGRFALLVDKGLLGATSTEDTVAATLAATSMAVPQQSDGFLSEYRRVLAPGGWAVVVMPSGAVDPPWFGEAVRNEGWSVVRSRAELEGGTVYALQKRNNNNNNNDNNNNTPPLAKGLQGAPSWVAGVEASRHKVVVRTAGLGQHERQQVKLHVSDAAAVLELDEGSLRDGSTHSSFQVQLPGPAIAAKWFRNCLEISCS
ncbi:unnamed protein product [Polarella glacialis]|uniref:Methyltransferase type 11 domain-containing protein n=1 Tax=Polarella glacialis TaxID=89957 RepID=A0A813KZ08_POLGL|nr:unnamed protein product [Polarella glacialis]